MPQLSDTRVLVTAGTSGLGLAMAQALARAGARVALTSRRRSVHRPPPKPSAPVPWASGSTSAIPTPVSSAVDSAYDSLGGLDVLVNNAGIGMRTVNPHFMTDPQPFWKSRPPVSGMSLRRRPRVRSWSRGRCPPDC